MGRSGLWPDWLPVGVAIMAGLAAVSSALVAARPAQASAEKVMWTFARPHFLMYEPRIKEWNASGRTRFELRLLSLPAIERRMMASFLVDGQNFHQRWRLIDLWTDLYLVGLAMLGADHESIRPSTQPEIWEAALAVGAVCVCCLLYLRRRIQAVEIVN